MGRLRFIFALWTAKCARAALRLLGRNATYLPGKIALTLCPDFMARIGKPEKIIAVTGTNGKTTVSNMLKDILGQFGYDVMNNQLGSNIASGIASSLLAGSGALGKTRYGMAVFEVDERSSRLVYPHVKPDILAVTNLSRDSIMRNAHPQFIASIIEKYVPETTKLVLNGDDLISANIAPKNSRVYFGIDRLNTDVTECVNIINDMQICPRCGGRLDYEYRRYHHIGKARCSDCGFCSPDCDYLAKNVDIEGMTMTFAEKGEEYEYKLLSDSIFNIYDMVTAISVLREMGFSHEKIRPAMDKTRIVESRYNLEKADDVSVIMQMSKDKNPLACSRVFDYVNGLPGNKELILMMSCLEDDEKSSENVCWLYDCDFEFLNDASITRIVTAGPRAKDFHLRLLMAGVPEDRLRCTEKELDAPPLLRLDGGESVFIFYGTAAVDLAHKVQEKTKKLVLEAHHED